MAGENACPAGRLDTRPALTNPTMGLRRADMAGVTPSAQGLAL